MPLAGEICVFSVTFAAISCGILSGAGADHVAPASALFAVQSLSFVVALETRSDCHIAITVPLSL
jgi:hypothetical protein